jgi:putative Mn2+ efflux pump MntP
VLKLLAVVLPLSLDSFAAAAAFGTTRPGLRQRIRVSLIFVVFEAGMPLIGLGAGTALARAIGAVAGYLAAAAIIVVGGWLLLSGRDDGPPDAAARLTHSRGLAVLALGLSISLDELAIGFGLGLVRLPLIPVITAIAVQAFIASQLGLWLGALISNALRERAEQLAGIALILLGGYLITERLAS